MAVLGGKGSLLPLLLLFGLLFAAAGAEDGDADPLYRWVLLLPLPRPEIPSAAISSLVVTTVRYFGLVLLGFSFQLGRAVHSYYSLLILFLARSIDSLTFIVLLL
jgi:hypothetical protein